VDLSFSSEQDELRAQTRAYLEEHAEPTWPELAELGWTGVSVAEQDGGAGLGFVEEAVLFEELGRALYHGPFFSTIAVTLPALPSDLRAEVAAGQASWTLALGPLVSDLDSADRVAIVGGDGIYELEGAKREVLSTTDVTRPLGVVRGGEPGRRLADAGALVEIRLRALTALALEACGVARHALELAVEHASSREQFGRPIGAYQAVSHPLADAYTRLELARSLALWSACCVAERDEQASLAAAAAKAAAAEAAVEICETAIQVHGGIGFTWEHPLHRLYKRALWIESFLASGTQLRAEVSGVLLDARRDPAPATKTPVAAGQGG
jgi:alkylation response protein AidB-like acyl-CoA dehydrogenase